MSDEKIRTPNKRTVSVFFYVKNVISMRVQRTVLRKKAKTLFPFSEQPRPFVKCILTRFSITAVAVKPLRRANKRADYVQSMAVAAVIRANGPAKWDLAESYWNVWPNKTFGKFG